jgi:glutathione S-transferase
MAAAAAVVKPTLHYFAFRGRAFASRVALFNALGKDGWIDQRVSLPRFQKQQQHQQQQQQQHSNQSQTTPLPPPPLTDYVTKTLPQLDLPAAFFNDGRSKSSNTAAAGVTKLTQSHAIARYAAKLLPPTHTTNNTHNHNNTTTTNTHFVPQLYPTDPYDALLVDEAIAIVEQILLLTPKDADPTVKAQNRKQYYQSGYLRIGMEVLERRLHDTAAGGPFLLGPHMTIGDLYLRAPLGDLFEYQQFDGIPASFYHDFPQIQHCAAAVLEHPLVKKYHQHYKN